MRFLRLDLIAFGPFTKTSIPLHEGRFGLHLVYGPNEAGKSSALRALTYFLFGIPNQCPDDFVHSYSDMRIGGAIESSDGTTHEWVRRKGRAKTLRAADDSTEADSRQLETLLAGVDEKSFERRFGINYANLVAGGRAIAEDKGDLGEALFAAGSGIANLQKLLTGLEAEAGELFKPSGLKPAINKLLSEIVAARSQIRSEQLPTSEWKKREKELADAEKRRRDVEERLANRSAELASLTRVRDALPLIARRAALLNERTTLESTPLLPPDFTDRRINAIARLNADRRAADGLSKAIAEREREITGANGDSSPDKFLRHADRLKPLAEEVGETDKAYVRDRPALIAEVESLERASREIVRDLGFDPKRETIDALRLTKSERARIDELKVAENGLKTKLETADDANSRAKRELDAVRRQIEELPPIVEGTTLRQAVLSVQKRGELEEAWEQKRAECERAESDAAKELARLPLWSGELESLESLAVPALDTIERCDEELREATQRVDAIEKEIKEVEVERSECDREIERLRMQQDVPTEDDLAAARNRRDAGWRLVRDAWLEGRTDVAEQDEFLQSMGGDDLATSYESSVSAADSVADRLRREAQQVERKSQLLTDRARCEERLADAQKRDAEARDELQRIQSGWRSLWTPLSIEPLTPREMRSWHGRCEAIVQKGTAIRALRREADGLRERIDANRRLLLDSLGSLGLLESIGLLAPADSAGTSGDSHRAPSSQSLSLGQLLQACTDVLRDMDAAAAKRAQLNRDVDRLEAEQRDTAERHRRAQSEMDEWRKKWTSAVARLRLPDDASPAQAAVVFDSLDELEKNRRELERLRERIRGIESNAERFMREVAGVVKEIETKPNAAIENVEAALATARRLLDRLGDSRDQQTRIDGLNEQQARDKKKLEDTNRSLGEQNALLEALCREAHVDDVDKLAEVEKSSRRRVELERDVRALNDRLVALAASESLDDFIQRAGSHDADRLPAIIADLEAEIRALDEERGSLRESIAVQFDKRNIAIGGASTAAEARERQELLLGKLRADVDEYARVRLAAVLLRSAMERYRQRHQGPVLDRASRLFAGLTNGSFAGLKADYDGNGNPVLVGVRPGKGRSVPVVGMSEGTCDQLYLSLRLASLETWLDDHSPIPFIVDDILVNFDDARAAAALRTLGEVSRRTQVILFTHHQHLVELAQREVDRHMLFVHELNRDERQLDEA